jgi:dihydrofolate reductase
LKITIIVAQASNRVIGKENQLVWRLQADLQLFKKHTTGHHLIMGRKTYQSVGRPLPNRTSIVITRNPDFKLPEGHYVVHSIEEAVQICIAKKLDQVFIIGGAEIYLQAMPIADELLVTEVDTVVDGDAYFPEIDPADWKQVSSEHYPKDANNEYAFDFVLYKRANS